MKQLYSRLLLILAIVAASLGPVPAAAQNTTLTQELANRGIVSIAKLRQRDFTTILAQEGEDLTLYSESTASILTTTTSASPANMNMGLDNTTANGASLVPPGPGRMYYMQSISVSLVGLPTGTCASFQVGGYGDTDSKFPQFVLRSSYCAGAPPTVFPVNKLFRYSRTARSGLAGTIRTVSPAVSSTTAVTVVASATGVELTDDPAFFADKTIVVFGDSLNYGKGYGPAQTQDLYAFKYRDALRAAGQDVRIVSFSQPGRSSTMMEADRASGKFDFLSPATGIYAEGTNDALIAAAGFDNTWAANFTAFWNWWHAKWPTSPLYVVTPGPLKLSADSANAATLVAKMTATVAAINSPLCKLINISNAFDRTDPGNIYFRPSDNVHWSTAGHAAVWTSMQSQL